MILKGLTEEQQKWEFNSKTYIDDIMKLYKISAAKTSNEKDSGMPSRETVRRAINRELHTLYGNEHIPTDIWHEMSEIERYKFIYDDIEDKMLHYVSNKKKDEIRAMIDRIKKLNNILHLYYVKEHYDTLSNMRKNFYNAEADETEQEANYKMFCDTMQSIVNEIDMINSGYFDSATKVSYKEAKGTDSESTNNVPNIDITRITGLNPEFLPYIDIIGGVYSDSTSNVPYIDTTKITGLNPEFLPYIDIIGGVYSDSANNVPYMAVTYDTNSKQDPNNVFPSYTKWKEFEGFSVYDVFQNINVAIMESKDHNTSFISNDNMPPQEHINNVIINVILKILSEEFRYKVDIEGIIECLSYITSVDNIDELSTSDLAVYMMYTDKLKNLNFYEKIKEKH